MTIEELQRRLQQQLADVKPLALKSKEGDLSDEEDTRFNELIDSINEVRKDLQAAETRQAKADEVLGTIDALGQTRGRVSGIQPIGPDGQRASAATHGTEQQFRGIGHRFIESEDFQRYRKNPKGNSQGVEYGSAYHGQLRAVDLAQELGAPDQRALVHGGSFANYIQPVRLPGIVSGDPFPLRIRDVLQNGRTDSPAVEFVVKNATTNNAAGWAEPSSVGAATNKAESAISLEVKSTTVKTLAHFIPVTRNMLQDAAQIESFIEAELLYGLRQEEDTQIVNGAGGADLTGILNTTGIQELDAAYWASNPLPYHANPLDTLRRAIKQIQVTGESNASFIAAHPDDLEEWETLKDANGNYLLRDGGPDNGGVTRIWRRPVVESLSVTAGHPLVGDGRRAIVLDKMDGQIFMTDSHSDWFTKNLFAILAESRLALAVTFPAGFVHVDIAAAMGALAVEP
jgi:hypothetical protein